MRALPEPFKSHHSGMEIIYRDSDHHCVPPLNRTIVGWKCEYDNGEPHWAHDFKSHHSGMEICNGVGEYRYREATLNRTIVGWKFLLEPQCWHPPSRL